MRVIAIASQKGGAGKSTLAAHLSVWADKPRKPALLIDIDPQASLTMWHSLRPVDSPVLVQCKAQELAATLRAARRDELETVIVDTPPHDSAEIAQAMRAASAVLIPTRAALFDIAAISATVDMARSLKRPHLVVLNAVQAKRGTTEATIVSEARRALEAMGAPVWAGQITQRAGLAHALASGQAAQEFEPKGAAAAEIAKLWRDVLKLTKEA